MLVSIPRLRDLGVAAVAAAVTVALVWLATLSLVGAAVGVVALLGLCAALAVGLEVFGTALICAAMALAPLTAVTLPGGLSFITASDLLLVIGFGVLAPRLSTRRFHLTWPFLAGSVLYFLGSIVSSVLAAHPVSSLNLLLRLIIALVGLPLLFALWGPRGRVLMVLPGAYVTGVCFNVVYAKVITGPSTMSAGRYAGLAEHPTTLGYSSILAVSMLPFLWAVIAPRRRWLVIAAGMISVYGIWIAGSRTGLVVLAALLLIYPAIERSVKVTIALIFLGTVFAASIGHLTSTGNSNALARLLGGTGATASDNARITGLTNALDVFKAHPLFGGGYTLDSFLAHNVYVQAAAWAGVIGLGALFLMLCGFVAPVFRARRPWGLLAYPALTFIVAGPITPNLGSRYVTIVLGLALILNSRDFERPGDDPEQPEPPPVSGSLTSRGDATIHGGR